MFQGAVQCFQFVCSPEGDANWHFGFQSLKDQSVDLARSDFERQKNLKGVAYTRSLLNRKNLTISK